MASRLYHRTLWIVRMNGLSIQRQRIIEGLLFAHLMWNGWHRELLTWSKAKEWFKIVCELCVSVVSMLTLVWFILSLVGF